MKKAKLNKIHLAEDMLKGNINRMCVTDSIEELHAMRYWAEKRLTEIYEINHQRILEENFEKEEINHSNGQEEE